METCNSRSSPDVIIIPGYTFADIPAVRYAEFKAGVCGKSRSGDNGFGRSLS